MRPQDLGSLVCDVPRTLTSRQVIANRSSSDYAPRSRQLSGNCLSDITLLRAEPDIFDPVASGPTICRLIDILAAAGPEALTAIRTAPDEVHLRNRELAGANGPAADGQVILELDGVLVLAHSEKQDAAAKKPFGHQPLVVFVDHSPTGSGEPVAVLLPGNRRLQHRERSHNHLPTRPGPTAQTPEAGRQTLIHTDSAGGPSLPRLALHDGPVAVVVHGRTITYALQAAVLKIP